MKSGNNYLRLYAITNRKNESIDLLCEQVEIALQHGVTCLQVREKDSDFPTFLAVAKALQPICKKYNVPLLINDNIEIALAIDADGVHIGQDDGSIAEARKRIGKEKILGVTANNQRLANIAEKEGADYIGSGSVFPTKSKKDVDILAHDELCRICQSVNIPVVAIGGISLENMDELVDTGIAGISVISAIFSAKNIGEATTLLRHKMDNLGL